MNRATLAVVSSFGTLAALAGLEHGIGEILQGKVAPGGTMFLSWPDSAFFEILGGEPAMTLVPNLLLSGILTALLSLVFLGWATLLVQRKNGGLVLILLSVLLLLVGGGFGPPLLGIILGVVATQIHAPLTWWRSRPWKGVGHFLGRLWHWSFALALVAWLLLLPGLPILAYFFAIEDPRLVLAVILFSFGFLLLSILSGFARDAQGQPTPAFPGARVKEVAG